MEKDDTVIWRTRRPTELVKPTDFLKKKDFLKNQPNQPGLLGYNAREKAILFSLSHTHTHTHTHTQDLQRPHHFFLHYQNLN